ncbi:MAG: AMP-binding protein [Eubacteriales bacterium]|nr:AMP-binding protein [Eubacteriales bacterium]MDD3199652.1 AMP-binding protein [Eubacteriales bacterium]MDD4121365.1 AMP-binding protein [Eubacteriales bacterium]MDD4629793.1 AMP-binding protein [Eubacteriales bacterium]
MKASQYEAIKPQEMEYALKRVEDIKNSKDRYVIYRDIRPIIDLKHMLISSAELFGDNIAFHVKDKVGGSYRGITYNEVKSDTDALGTALTSMGLKGKNISIIGDNRYEWAISYLSTVCGTGVAVPLDKELNASELEQLIKEADVECMIYTQKYESVFLDMKARGETNLKYLINMDQKISDEQRLSWWELIAAGKVLIENGNKEFLDAVIDRDAMGVILFTSGTTGISKGVMLSHGNIAEDLMASPTLLEVKPTDVFFSVLPLHHTYECTCGFLMPLFRGASVAYCEGLKYIVKNLSEARPTIFLGVPLLIEGLYKKIWKNAKKTGKAKTLKRVIAINRKTKKIGIDLAPVFFKQIIALFGGRMKVIICGGAAIDPEVLQGIRDFGINAVQGYGLTECAPICALNPDKYPKNDSAGYAPPGFGLKIHEPDPETGIGEICAEGGNVMLGYFNNPQATAEVLKDGWFHTGDMGYMDKDNFVYITGRIKNVIITKNGKNIYPEELEYYLGKIPYVSESLVWGKDNEESGETLISASIRADYEEVAEALGENYKDEEVTALIWKEIDKLNTQLPFFKRIKKVDIRKEEFDKTTGKKIKRFVDSNKGI